MTEPAAAPTTGRRLDDLQNLLQARFPLFKDIVPRAVATFGESWSTELEVLLNALLPDKAALERAVEGYVGFALDMMRRQRRFETERRYPDQSYAETLEAVYHDRSYMDSQYLPGLLLSHYFWSHHYHQLRFFDVAYVDQLRHSAVRHFLEIGVGTGMYSRRVLERVPDATGMGFDISTASQDFTERHIASFGLGARYQSVVQDVVANPVEPTRWLICVEVLEHLEDPPAFLDVLRAALEPGGLAFITAAINAPHIDHIYLYEDPRQVRQQLHAAGFELEQAFVATAHKPRLPGLPVPEIAAYIVT